MEENTEVDNLLIFQYISKICIYCVSSDFTSFFWISRSVRMFSSCFCGFSVTCQGVFGADAITNSSVDADERADVVYQVQSWEKAPKLDSGSSIRGFSGG